MMKGGMTAEIEMLPTVEMIEQFKLDTVREIYSRLVISEYEDACHVAKQEDNPYGSMGGHDNDFEEDVPENMQVCLRFGVQAAIAIDAVDVLLHQMGYKHGDDVKRDIEERGQGVCDDE